MDNYLIEPQIKETVGIQRIRNMKNQVGEVDLEVKNLSFYYHKFRALKNLTMNIKRNRILSIIGPSGCGKTTLLRCFNRIHELHPKNRYEGEVLLDGVNILDRSVDVVRLRSRIGMVFQKPTPFPMSIQGNIAYALSIKGISNKTEVNDRIEKALKKVGLWNEIAHRLKMDAFELSDGQQQRLVIARALAVEPEIMLFDEPTNALDPLSTSKIEELLFELKSELTILIVTHNMQQAARMSDDTAFLYMGELVECNETNSIFTNPINKLTEDYVTGRFG